GAVDAQNETISAKAKFLGKASSRPPVLVAALGPQALGVSGRRADGTILAWVGPKTIGSHIAPRIQQAAADAGRDTPQIVASLPICVTDNESQVRETISRGLAWYGQLPSYRAMFDREGVDGPGDVAIVGSIEKVTDGVAAMAAAGVTEFAPTEFFTNSDEAMATRSLLQSLLSQY
ncbi:MAG: LLM class flavin-dependent oxidoreductase, partial [Pseudomonadota bacterium]